MIWPNRIQVALQRGLSDHVTLVLSVDEENWGPRPIQMLKCWADFPNYANFVRHKWCSFAVDGWGGYVLKQKLKMFKCCLKEWHQCHNQNMDRKIRAVKERISTLDSKGESSVLVEEEVAELHDLSVNLHSLALIHASTCCQ